MMNRCVVLLIGRTQVFATTLARSASVSLTLTLTVFVAACNGDNKNTIDPMTSETLSIDTDSGLTNNFGVEVSLDAPMRWKLGPASYGENAISWRRKSPGGRIVLYVSTPFDDTSNGDYAGSTVTLHFKSYCDQYTVVDNVSLNTGCTAFIVVTAGTERVPLASSRWASSSVGTITAYYGGYDEDGYEIFHVSTPEPLTLTRDFNQGTGVPNSPEHISFEMQNLHGEDLCGPDGRWC